MKTIKAILLEDLATNKADLADHETIKAALLPANGKALNGRLQRLLPDGFKLEDRAGMTHVRSPRGNSHLIGYHSHAILEVDKLDNFDSWAFNGANSRISQIEGFLNNPEKMKQLTSMFMKVKKAWAAFCKVANELEYSKMDAFNNPAYYDLLRNFNVPYRIISDIRFNKIQMD
jgi:hypothetical protein